ncbi:macro domain-containing protein [Trichocoleus sp. FACHB-262]|uniref:type II toxin-antitoxin system antitoxin DNA ADP-ribosyl glycohydrolase DarG n=1 Tax=Trichocoleus sp. FACHB-262 TaxID=2692869 RepID=UPI00168790A1|nr:macro domain-containing protein [Trichocoleus sp. FACHB-262]MBD2119354.1 macro domain-containing protein [Trichocoleus sp. FACHB-262]
MIQFTTGDILQSNASCLVNTVNCEGYMGKGIAYQFKLMFPENNRDYVKACRNGSLKIGKIHYFWENNKLIVNFPTKDKWREKSKTEYIHKGLLELVKLIKLLELESIAIPPLGCGNGGLSWAEVRPMILEHLFSVSDFTEILIYEPSQYFISKSSEAPKLNVRHLVLRIFKLKLNKFNKLRLQKTAYFMNIFLGKSYFKFSKYKYGPYAHSIDILTKDIKEFQDFYEIPTEEAFKLAKTTLTSKSIDQKIKDFEEFIDKATDFVNELTSDKDLELVATICSLLEAEPDITTEKIIREIKDWSQEKANRFSEEDILEAVRSLELKNIIQINLMGLYSLSKF